MENYMTDVLIFILPVVACCFILQRICRKSMDTIQYNYFRDLLLLGAWVLCALWAGTPVSRFIVGMAVLASILGMGQRLYPSSLWKGSYLILGLVFALFGPRIAFLGLPGGEYHYFQPGVSILLTALWIAVFPLLLQELDNIPGMSGHLVAISFSLMLITTVFSGQSLPEAFFLSLSGLSLLGVFWSRHGHMYRRMGESLAALWGTLVAGTSVLGVSKGITFSTLLLLPLGLFAIPIMETSLHFVSRVFSSRSAPAAVLYRKLISRGLDHPSAVRFITSLCALGGALVAISRLGNSLFMILWVSVTVLFTGIALLPFLRKMGENGEASGKPTLWRTAIDNVSMNYALSRSRGAVTSSEGLSLVATVNALAVLEAERNPRYSEALSNSFLTLADGTGLVWALKFLGRPVQERVAGIDFMAGLARMAAAERWPVYLLGAKEEVVVKAAEKLQELFPEIILAGWRNGYFDPEDPEIPREIRESGAKVLFAALGVPKQEIWLHDRRNDLGNILAVGVGGAFDVISGSLKRAPLPWQKMGLEWLYRLFQEPWRWKRDLELFRFAGKVFLTRFGGSPSEKKEAQG
ncbi:WecB/TagA/CpsF family glycosyltransferase [Aminivibrio sp.]